MFRCCDCGCEYEVKPDFCDCGNNVFEEIVSTITEVEEYEKLPKKKKRKTFEEQYPGLSSFVETLDPISVIIFILCIVLSICSFIFIKPKENAETQVPKDEPKVERKVADINTFWNDTPPKPEPKKAAPQPTTEDNLVNQIINVIPKTEEPKPVQNNTNVQKPKTVSQKPVQTQTLKPKQTQQTTRPKVQVSKPSQTQKPVKTQIQKPVQTQKPKVNTTAQQNTQITTKPVSSTQQPQKPVTQTPQTQQIWTPSQVQQQTNTVSAQQAAQELKTFKKELQSAYASRIKSNLLQVYGDGSCVIDFKVASTGKITNRSFSQQSSNNTLNDAVYHAVMAMPSFKTPPDSYKGQTLHLSVRITNGMAQIYVY